MSMCSVRRCQPYQVLSGGVSCQACQAPALSGAVREPCARGFGLTALTALDSESCQACQACQACQEVVRKLSGDGCQVVRPGLNISRCCTRGQSRSDALLADPTRDGEAVALILLTY